MLKLKHIDNSNNFHEFTENIVKKELKEREKYIIYSLFYPDEAFVKGDKFGIYQMKDGELTIAHDFIEGGYFDIYLDDLHIGEINGVSPFSLRGERCVIFHDCAEVHANRINFSVEILSTKILTFKKNGQNK